ncbi:MAG: RluA family pseudouridine synthase [Acidobacteriota bacterium]
MQSSDHAARLRLARAVQQLLATSYSRAKREVEIGHVLVNDRIVTDPGFFVTPDDKLSHRPELRRLRRTDAAPRVELVHLDESVVVVNKPSGLLVHPGPEGEKDTLLWRVATEIERRTGERHGVFVVHRLDRDTSGLLLFARTHAAAERLVRMFRGHDVSRRYLALVRGDFEKATTVDRDIGRPRAGARRAVVRRHGKEARTNLRPVERYGKATLVEATLYTGRTHQVRVHLSYLGHPVLGDTLYGDPRLDPVEVPRLALHAAHIGFAHPVSGTKLEFDAGLPEDLAAVVRRLRGRETR